MKQTERERIAEALRVYVSRYPSQNKAAASLTGVSAATVSAILKGNHSVISEDMWRNVDKQVRPATVSKGWQIVETTAYNEMQAVLADAQLYGNVRWVVGDAGCGKTTAARCYEASHRDVFRVLCSKDMRKSDFVREIARRVGIKTAGKRLREMLEATTDYIKQLDSPLLIFDEGDKLQDDVMHYFIDIYNHLEDYSGIVFLSTASIEHRIARGVRNYKPGYAEIFSRIGRRYYELEPTAPNDVIAICQANGLETQKTVNAVIKATNESDYDLRAVKSEIHRQKRMAAAEKMENEK